MYVDRTLINLNNHVKWPNCAKGEKMNIRIVMMYLVVSDEYTHFALSINHVREQFSTIPFLYLPQITHMLQDCFHLRNSRLWSESPPRAYTFYRDGAVIKKGAASSYNTTHVTYRDNLDVDVAKKPKKIPFLRLIRNHSTGCWEIADVSQYLI